MVNAAFVDTSAYDLSAFDEKTNIKSSKNIEHIVSRKRQKSNRKAVVAVTCWCVSGFLFFGILLVNNAQLIQINSVVNSLKNELAVEMDNYNHLSLEYERMIDLRFIENEAKYSYGMGKIERSQIEFIGSAENDYVEIIKAPVGVSIANLFSDIKKGILSLF